MSGNSSDLGLGNIVIDPEDFLRPKSSPSPKQPIHTTQTSLVDNLSGFREVQAQDEIEGYRDRGDFL